MKEKIILFGAGNYSLHLMEKVEKYFIIQAVCDNNSALWGNKFIGKYPIISAEDVVAKYSGLKILIAIDDKKIFDEICEQFLKWNIECQHINDALYEKCVKEKTLFSVDCEEKEIRKLHVSNRNIFVLTAPSHSNLGDQAQSYCIEDILKKQYPDSNIIIYDEYRIIKNYYELLYIMKQSLKSEDIILLHSGYRLTNLYMVSEHIVEMMGRLFADRKMIFLPQTINYTDENVKRRISKIIKNNVTIMCRDEVSYEKAKEIFTESKLLLYPDVVTSLIGRYRFENKRDGFLLCFRSINDGESMFCHEEVCKLIDKIKKFSNVTMTDTTIDADWKDIAENRKKYIEKEINAYSKFEVVITNRYHGVIFALAADTPVIVLPTADHKITAGLKWFKQAGYKGIYFCEKIEQASEAAREVINNGEQLYNGPYFYENFYREFDLEAYL